MAKRCDLTGTGPLVGNNVSHSKRRTRTRFMPNLQNVSLMSDALGRTVKLKVTAATLRTVEHNGGLDKFLLKRSDTKLTDEARRLKRQVKKKLASVEAA